MHFASSPIAREPMTSRSPGSIHLCCELLVTQSVQINQGNALLYFHSGSSDMPDVGRGDRISEDRASTAQHSRLVEQTEGGGAAGYPAQSQLR